MAKHLLVIVLAVVLAPSLLLAQRGGMGGGGMHGGGGGMHGGGGFSHGSAGFSHGGGGFNSVTPRAGFGRGIGSIPFTGGFGNINHPSGIPGRPFGNINHPGGVFPRSFSGAHNRLERPGLGFHEHHRFGNSIVLGVPFFGGYYYPYYPDYPYNPYFDNGYYDTGGYVSAPQYPTDQYTTGTQQAPPSNVIVIVPGGSQVYPYNGQMQVQPPAGNQVQPDQQAQQNSAPAGPPEIMLAFKSHAYYGTNKYWVAGDSICFVTAGGEEMCERLSDFDPAMTRKLNPGVKLNIPTTAAESKAPKSTKPSSAGR